VSLIGRWDYWNVSEANPISSSNYIVGAAYHISGRNKLLIDYNFVDNNTQHSKPDAKRIEVMFELAF
jgi:hypothetical protein